MNLVELELDETLADFEVQDWIDNVFSVQYPDVKARIKKSCSGLCHKKDEWHYPSKGKYPKAYKDILICFLTEDDMKDCVRGWCEYDSENDKYIFKYLNVLGTQYLETVIAWKEIVLLNNTVTAWANLTYFLNQLRIQYLETKDERYFTELVRLIPSSYKVVKL